VTPVAGVISAFASHAGSAGVFSDFDGTLARIVDDPGSARPLAGAAEALEALGRRYARVGVISGRPGAFLAEHLGGRGLALTGLYGLEVVTPAGVRPVQAAKAWRSVVEEVAGRAEAELPPALGIERKDLSVAGPPIGPDVRALSSTRPACRSSCARPFPTTRGWCWPSWPPGSPTCCSWATTAAT